MLIADVTRPRREAPPLRKAGPRAAPQGRGRRR
jgi:hypothetical protein